MPRPPSPGIYAYASFSCAGDDAVHQVREGPDETAREATKHQILQQMQPHQVGQY